MKKIFATLTLTALFLAANAGTLATTTLNEKIQSEITYPDFAKENSEQGFVLLSFTVDNEGKVIVKEVNGNSQALNSYVVRKIEELTVDCNDEKCKDYTMKFEFRII